MTGDPSNARKPYDPAAYASLRTADSASSTRADPSSNPKDAAANDFLSEGERLRALREALWAAFEAGPAAGLPNTLIDLTMAYTSALRLQLNLKSLKSHSAAAKVRPANAANPPRDGRS